MKICVLHIYLHLKFLSLAQVNLQQLAVIITVGVAELAAVTTSDDIVM